MIIANIEVGLVTATVRNCQPIPRGLAGACVAVKYTHPAWEGLHKTVVFRGAVTRDVLDPGEEVVIPWETVETAGKSLYIGFYGTDEASGVVIPTIWAELGAIQGAADPSGDVSTDPSLNVWEQLQNTVGTLEELNTAAKGNLVEAINETLSVAEQTQTESGVYVLSEEESLDDVPGDVDVVVDPYGTEDMAMIPSPSFAAVGQALVVKAVNESGNPTEWEAVDFPQGGVSGWEDLGTTFEEGVILPETTVVIDPETGEGVLPDVISLTIGNEYTVNWNGVSYQCVAFDASAIVPGGVGIGDIGMLENGEPTEGGAPFVIFAAPADLAAEEGIGVMLASFDGAGTVTLSIEGNVEIITPVPDKYLPDNTMTVFIAKDDSGKWSADKNIGDIISAASNGLTITAICPAFGYAEVVLYLPLIWNRDDTAVFGTTSYCQLSTDNGVSHLYHIMCIVNGDGTNMSAIKISGDLSTI